MDRRRFLRDTLGATLLGSIFGGIPVEVLSQASAPDIGAGPLLGYVSNNYAYVWTYEWPDGSNYADVDKIRFGRSDSAHFTVERPIRRRYHSKIWKLELSRLGTAAGDTNVWYEPRKGNRSLGRYTFTRPGSTELPEHFTVAVASCMNRAPYDCSKEEAGDRTHQRAWWFMDDLPRQTYSDGESLRRGKINALLLTGDTIYIPDGCYDTESKFKNAFIDLNRIQRKEGDRDRGGFQKIVPTTPTYAVWDDHDFATGSENADRDNRYKRLAMELFQTYWPAEYFREEGIHYEWGIPGVSFFMLDTRFFRSPKGKQPQEILGKEQEDWLIDALKEAHGRGQSFKVICSSTTLQKGGDAWNKWPGTSERLFERLRQEGVPGILWVSGDIHNSQHVTHRPRSYLNYPLHEVISSGVGLPNDHGKKGFSFATLTFKLRGRADPLVDVRYWGNHDFIRKGQDGYVSREDNDRFKANPERVAIHLSDLRP